MRSARCWAVICSGAGGSVWVDPKLPEGCTVVSRASHSDASGSINWWVIRVADAAALVRLRQQEDEWPFDHGPSPLPDDPDPGCGGKNCIVAEYAMPWSFARIIGLRCENCRAHWPDGMDSEVQVFNTKTEAVDYIDERSLVSFLGL